MRPFLSKASGRSLHVGRTDRRKKTQDGRKLSSYRGRKIQRLFLWLQIFRRLVVRYEYKDENFLGKAQLGAS
jgi:hypothetical protein